MSAAGVAGDLLPEKPVSLETMATAARPRFAANDGDGKKRNQTRPATAHKSVSVVRYRGQRQCCLCLYADDVVPSRAG